ncbi:replication initiator protein [Microviridae sp.]|nr:replication initiator protein [Microviridae sp.]
MGCNFPVALKAGDPRLGVRPCGKCIGCRLDYSRAKAVRAMHELESHERSSFVTLTYDDRNLVYGEKAIAPTLVKRDLQLFWKQLRRRIEPRKISYMASGEYGENTERPHYHAIIFGEDFSDDREFWKQSESGNLYTSQLLSDAWGNKGHAVFGAVTFESAAYVASYTIKKLNGEMAKSEYDDLGRIPPFGAMSTKPAIGRRWIEKNLKDVYNHDSVIMRGHEQRPPRYYDEIKKVLDPESFKEIQRSRRDKMEERLKNNFVASGSVTEFCQKSKISQKIEKF